MYDSYDKLVLVQCSMDHNLITYVTFFGYGLTVYFSSLATIACRHAIDEFN